MQHYFVILDSHSGAPLSGWCGLVEFWQNTQLWHLNLERGGGQGWGCGTEQRHWFDTRRLVGLKIHWLSLHFISGEQLEEEEEEAGGPSPLLRPLYPHWEWCFLHWGLRHSCHRTEKWLVVSEGGGVIMMLNSLGIIIYLRVQIHTRQDPAVYCTGCFKLIYFTLNILTLFAFTILLCRCQNLDLKFIQLQFDN